MAAIVRLLDDERVPATVRQQLQAERGAFMLGSVAPDARVEAPDPREATHFYSYTKGLSEHPHRLMLAAHPSLMQPKSAAHRAFVAGYVAHLAMDEVWSLDMLGPHFAFGKWGETREHRFFMLHMLLIVMDERDLVTLPAWIPEAVRDAAPRAWLPFMPQDVLTGWRDMIYAQIKPDGQSLTLDIFGSRINRTPDKLRRMVDDVEWMARELWNPIPPTVLAIIERAMYTHARESLVQYMQSVEQRP